MFTKTRFSCWLFLLKVVPGPITHNDREKN